MPEAMVRGPCSAGQQYVASVLAAARGAAGGAPALPHVLLHCLKQHPDDIFMVNADTGEKTSNKELLQLAIPLARMFTARGVKGRVVVIAYDVTKTAMAIYLALLFAEAVPFYMDVITTDTEYVRSLKLVEPFLVLSEEKYLGRMTAALAQIPLATEVLGNQDLVMEEDVDSFQLPAMELSAVVMLIETSGTTGRYKAVPLTHEGIITHIPLVWFQIPPAVTHFPQELLLQTSSTNGISFYRFLVSCVVYRVTLLLPQTHPDVHWVKDKLVEYRPTKMSYFPHSISMLLPIISEDHLSSIREMLFFGAPLAKNTLNDLKMKLPKTALCYNDYGATEAQGTIAIAPYGEGLRRLNYLEYKIVDEKGDLVKKGEAGELHVKGLPVVKGYYKMAEHESFEDGWYKTGDRFREDEDGRLHFLERISICFKVDGDYVSPEESESVIMSVRGVRACFVGHVPRGAAAAVVALPGVCREDIHRAVNSNQSDYKWLRGGVAFVPALPYTLSGKLRRRAAQEMLMRLVESGECH